MTIRPREEDRAIESAITFMVEKINECNRNPKPLILHSVRVGLRLYAKEESTNIVIAGLLHDLVEDTNCTEADIEKKFGKELSQFVSVFNYDDPKMFFKERWTAAIEKMLAIGRDAAILKLVDIHDNLRYLGLMNKKKEIVEGLLWRYSLVRDSFKEILRDDEDYQLYCRDLEAQEKMIT